MKSKGTVLLGMSGGVDSSVAALLLQREGYKVIGAFIKCFSETKNKLTGECHWAEDRKDALAVAARLGIELITLDFEAVYKKEVIDPMFAAYKRGLTPNPDMACNTLIKFPLLWKEAKKLGADLIATGHYVRVTKTKSGFSLLRGKDDSKDQSYFLAELTQEDLSHSLFPLGAMKKSEVRAIARKSKLPNWDKQGTRGICFVGNIPMQSFLAQRLAEKKGNVVDISGNKLGTHRGAMYYTMGQRVAEHTGISITKPKEHAQDRYFIAGKKGNTLIVAPEGDTSLLRKEVVLKNTHFISGRKPAGVSLKARIRHLGELHSGKLVSKKGKLHFIFSKGTLALAEGQYLVLYAGEQVIGSGELRF